MADEFTGTKSLHFAGAQAPDLEHEEVRGEIVAGTKAQQHEQKVLAVSHGAKHPTGERVKVDQPQDVSVLPHPSKFSRPKAESTKEKPSE